MTIALYATIHAVQLHCNYFKHTYEARVEASQSLKSRSSHSRKGPGKPRFDEENSRPIQLGTGLRPNSVGIPYIHYS